MDADRRSAVCGRMLDAARTEKCLSVAVVADGDGKTTLASNCDSPELLLLILGWSMEEVRAGAFPLDGLRGCAN